MIFPGTIAVLIPVGTICSRFVNKFLELSGFLCIEVAVSIFEFAICKTKSQAMETKARLYTILQIWFFHAASIAGVE